MVLQVNFGINSSVFHLVASSNAILKFVILLPELGLFPGNFLHFNVSEVRTRSRVSEKSLFVLFALNFPNFFSDTVELAFVGSDL